VRGTSLFAAIINAAITPNRTPLRLVPAGRILAKLRAAQRQKPKSKLRRTLRLSLRPSKIQLELVRWMIPLPPRWYLPLLAPFGFLKDCLHWCGELTVIHLTEDRSTHAIRQLEWVDDRLLVNLLSGRNRFGQWLARQLFGRDAPSTLITEKPLALASHYQLVKN
jgi:hypothetical protein